MAAACWKIFNQLINILWDRIYSLSEQVGPSLPSTRCWLRVNKIDLTVKLPTSVIILENGNNELLPSFLFRQLHRECYQTKTHRRVESESVLSDNEWISQQPS